MNNNPPTQPDNWISNPYVTNIERKAIADKWIDSIYKLYNRSTGRARKSLGWDIYYIEKFFGYGVPLAHANGGWGLRRWLERQDDSFVIVPLFSSDAELHPFFAGALHRPTYRENPPAIYLPSDRISPIWRAIILHHELGHTMFHRLKIYRDGNEMDHWTEEYEVYVNEFRLIRSIYGRHYGQLITQLSKKYEPGLRKGKLHAETKSDIDIKQLKRIFGRPESKLERQIWQGLVMLNAMYRALDRIHSNGDKTEHYKITKWFYGANK